jgi:hypothetical protein
MISYVLVLGSFSGGGGDVLDVGSDAAVNN